MAGQQGRRGRGASQYRRPRGTDVVALNMFVAPDVKETIDAIAAAANAPMWAVVEAAIKAGRPGPDGVPEGWVFPKADPEPKTGQGSFDIDVRGDASQAA